MAGKSQNPAQKSKIGAVIVFCWLVLLGFGSATGDEVGLNSLPPVVVKTIPQAGSPGIDPGQQEIRVTFSRKMEGASWSIIQVSPESFPKLVGKPFFTEDGLTCVIKVDLKPEKTYALWYNSAKFTNFKDTEGMAAVPYLLSFQTRK